MYNIYTTACGFVLVWKGRYVCMYLLYMWMHMYVRNLASRCITICVKCSIMLVEYGIFDTLGNSMG